MNKREHPTPCTVISLVSQTELVLALLERFLQDFCVPISKNATPARLKVGSNTANIYQAVCPGSNLAASFAVQSSRLRGGISSQAQGKGVERAALCHGTHPCLLVGVEGQGKSWEQQQHHCREFLPAPGSPVSLVDTQALRVNQLWSAGKATAGGSSAACANEE